MFIYVRPRSLSLFFFFNDTATTEIYTLSLHDALPIYAQEVEEALVTHPLPPCDDLLTHERDVGGRPHRAHRSEEHTSELQSHSDLVCRLLLEKKKKKKHKKNEQDKTNK